MGHWHYGLEADLTAKSSRARMSPRCPAEPIGTDLYGVNNA